MKLQTARTAAHAALALDTPPTIASSRCAVEFGRYRGIADTDQAAPIKLDL